MVLANPLLCCAAAPFPDDSVVTPLLCKATGRLLANDIQHGYNRASLCDKVKPFSAPFVQRPPGTPQARAAMNANDGGCSIRSETGTVMIKVHKTNHGHGIATAPRFPLRRLVTS